MPNFVRDGIAIDIPNDALALLKSCFDKDDAKIEALQSELDTFKKSIKTINIDGDDFKAEGAVIKAIEESKKIAQEKEALEAKVEALLAEVDQLRKDSSDEIIKQKLAERRALEKIATQVLPTENTDSFADMSDRELKETIITKRFDITLDSLQSKSDDAISAMVELASTLGGKTKSTQDMKEVKSSDWQGDSLTKAIAEQAEAISNAWQKTLIKEYQ